MSDDETKENEQKSAEVIHLFQAEEDEKDPDEDLLIELLKAVRILDRNVRRLAEVHDENLGVLAQKVDRIAEQVSEELSEIKEAVVANVMVLTPRNEAFFLAMSIVPRVGESFSVLDSQEQTCTYTVAKVIFDERGEITIHVEPFWEKVPDLTVLQ